MEYAESELFEPISFVADKDFKGYRGKQIHSLSNLLPGEGIYMGERFLSIKLRMSRSLLPWEK